MKLVLIRHAEAVALEETPSQDDFDRPLTEHGERQAAALAEALQRIGCEPTVILTSPLLRARQTAAILAATLSAGREPVVCERLGLDETRFKKLTREVAEHGPGVAFLVGHMPSLSDYAGWLLGADIGAVDFDKAAAALIKFAGPPAKGGGELKWLVPPAWFLIESFAVNS